MAWKILLNSPHALGIVHRSSFGWIRNPVRYEADDSITRISHSASHSLPPPISFFLSQTPSATPAEVNTPDSDITVCIYHIGNHYSTLSPWLHYPLLLVVILISPHQMAHTWYPRRNHAIQHCSRGARLVLLGPRGLDLVPNGKDDEEYHHPDTQITLALAIISLSALPSLTHSGSLSPNSGCH